MLLASVPNIIAKIFPSLIWSISEKEKVIYLTFDDGPIPETTEWILDVLDKYNAKATFFCVGENVQKYPNLYEKIHKNGHLTGNHTFNHLNGWNSDVNTYIENIEKAAKLIKSNLFRPPRGMIRVNQANALLEDYNIVMWNVLSIDYDQSISPKQCLKNVTSNAKEGSIVVFHDSIKAKKNMMFALPKALAYFSALGYSFESLKLSSYKKPKASLIESWVSYSFAGK